LETVQENSQFLLEELKESLAGKESVITIRGLGYMIGIETTGDLPDLVAKACAKGLIVLTAGTNVIRLLPPLTITRDQIQQAVGILKDIVD
jgi:acetylornithine aminotransferase